ncbi:MAG: CPBP family intramembrane metalloprotease [Eubacterium sp.]|nr:CPBP family intramembrane metalloprotease [Eubacterium sp.]
MKGHNTFVNRMAFLTFFVYLVGSFAMLSVFSGVLDGVYQISLLSEICLVAAPVLNCTARNVNVVEKFRIRAFSPVAAVWVVICTLCFYPCMLVANVLSQLVFETGTQAEVLSGSVLDGSVWAGILFVAVVPAVTEEIVCRGFFYSGYRNNGFWKASFLSALLFAGFHLNFNQFIYTFMMGIFLVFMLEATDSILASMLVHFTLNAFSVISVFSSYSQVDSEELEEIVEQGTSVRDILAGQPLAVNLFMGVFMVVIVAVSLILTRLVYKKVLQTTGRGEIVARLVKGDYENVPWSEIISPALIVALLLMSGYMVLYELAL